jgi:hypothetical protein
VTDPPLDLPRKVRQLDNDVQSIYEMLAKIGATQQRQGNRLEEIGGTIEEVVTRQEEHGEKLDAIIELLRGDSAG